VTSQQVPPGRIDIHSHILPGIDDGARSLQESLDMLRMAGADGTVTIVATPHGARVTPESVRKGVALLSDAAAASGIDMAIMAGCETKFSANLVEDYRNGKLLTINDAGYLLVEFSFSRAWTPLVHTSLYALQIAGVTPVVAHAERYPAVQGNPSLVVELARMGIPVQINAGSLLGDEGEQTRQTAENLILAGVGHVLASDGHRIDKRKPLLSEGLARVTELAGEQQALLMEKNAARIVAGQGLHLPEPDVSRLQKPSRFHRMLKRITG
jgi:protein-tyrosine phosphatase